MRLWILVGCAAFPFVGGHAFAADGNGDAPEVVGYGSNVEPDPSKKPMPAAGMGADIEPDVVQATAPRAGFGPSQTTGAFGPAPDGAAAATVAPPPQAGSGPYRNPKYKAKRVKPSAVAPQPAAVPASTAQSGSGPFRNAKYQVKQARPAAAPSSPGAARATSAPPRSKASTKRAGTLSDAKENMASLVREFLDRHGKDGLLALKIGAGPKQSLHLEGIDSGTVHSRGRGRFSAVVLFRDKKGRLFKTSARADLSGSDWRVTSISGAALVKDRNR